MRAKWYSRRYRQLYSISNEENPSDNESCNQFEWPRAIKDEQIADKNIFQHIKFLMLVLSDQFAMPYKKENSSICFSRNHEI